MKYTLNEIIDDVEKHLPKGRNIDRAELTMIINHTIQSLMQMDNVFLKKHEIRINANSPDFTGMS